MSEGGNAARAQDISRQSSKNLGATGSSNVSQGGANQETIPIDASINHYELPNLTQLLYDFTNKEQDLVMRCFRVGNYTSLRDLPANLMPNAVLKQMNEKQDTNLMWRQPAPKVATLTGGGLFSEYERMPDEYAIYLKIQQAEKSKLEKK